MELLISIIFNVPFSFSDVNGDDAYDLLTGNVSTLLDQSQQQQQQQQQQQSQDDNNAAAALAADSAALKSDLSSLLNSKLQQDTSTRGLHFFGNDDYNAKRNLTLMLESKQMSQGSTASDNNSGVNLFDDNFNSGSYGNTTDQQQQQQQSLFSSYTPKGDVTLASASLYGDSDKYMRGTRRGQCTPGGPTPPGSQNQTADLSQELNLAAMQQQLQQQQQNQQSQQQHQQQVTNIFNSNSTSGGSVIAALLNSTGSSLVDTPSSLDTLSGQDSRESLGDPFLHGFTDTVTDITSDLSASQSMDMEPLDFTFSNVDTVMTQMVP